MNYWIIVGEGGGYEEVKKVKSGKGGSRSGGVQRTTMLMDDLTFTMGEDGKTKLFVRGEETAPPDVFMLWGHYNEVFEGISERLISLGARSINDINGKRIVCSKLLTSLLLEKENLPQAKTMIVTHSTPARLVADTVGLPAVLKPSDGAQGSGVVLLHTEEEIAAYLAEIPEGSGRSVLAQEYIAASKGTDTRVCMVDYKMLYAIQRMAGNPDEFRSNVHLGGSYRFVELDAAAVELCERVAKAVGLRICGIDLLTTGDGYVVGEVNCTPGMPDEIMQEDSFKQAMYRLITTE